MKKQPCIKNKNILNRLVIKKVGILNFLRCMVHTAASVSTVLESIANKKLVQCSRKFSMFSNVWEHSMFSTLNVFRVYLPEFH
jgi:hypothetical protein